MGQTRVTNQKRTVCINTLNAHTHSLCTIIYITYQNSGLHYPEMLFKALWLVHLTVPLNMHCMQYCKLGLCSSIVTPGPSPVKASLITTMPLLCIGLVCVLSIWFYSRTFQIPVWNTPIITGRSDWQCSLSHLALVKTFKLHRGWRTWSLNKEQGSHQVQWLSRSSSPILKVHYCHNTEILFWGLDLGLQRNNGGLLWVGLYAANVTWVRGLASKPFQVTRTY